MGNKKIKFEIKYQLILVQRDCSIFLNTLMVSSSQVLEHLISEIITVCLHNPPLKRRNRRRGKGGGTGILAKDARGSAPHAFCTCFIQGLLLL